MSVKITGIPSSGTLTLNGTNVAINDVITTQQLSQGLLVYTAANDAIDQSFSFTVSDGLSDSNSATMTLDVLAVNSATEQIVTLSEDGEYTFSATEFSGVSSSIELTALPSVGKLYLNGVELTAIQTINLTDITAGNFKFVPEANQYGIRYANFTYTIDSGTTQHTIYFDVTAQNDAPTASDKTITTSEDIPYTFSMNDFGFSDIDGDALVSVKVITCLEQKHRGLFVQIR